jgi:hypothetical protein
MTDRYSIGDIISKNGIYNENDNTFFASIEGHRSYAIFSPKVNSVNEPTLSEQSTYKYQTASQVHINDMITVSDDVLDNNNFFDNKSFRFIKKTIVTLSENNQRIICNVMEKVQ